MANSDSASKNPEKKAARGREWRSRPDVRTREYERSKRNRLSDPARQRESVRKSYMKHRDARLERARAHAKENRQEETARRRRWATLNPFRQKAIDCRRRARRAGVQHVELNLGEIYERDNGICHICGTHVPIGEDLVFDHVVPFCHGGPHTAENVAVAHYDCNAKKGTRIIAQGVVLRKII
jgi:5-methylcytosine-specific restriction endonuclease McrA